MPEFYPTDSDFYGVLPDGESKRFASQREYEDAFWDMAFEMSNCFDIEMPEDF